MNTNTMPLEAETRILIDRSLENLGWKLNGKEQNVFYEQPRTEAEKKKLGGKRPDYVLYSKESDKPLITNNYITCLQFFNEVWIRTIVDHFNSVAYKAHTLNLSFPVCPE